MKGKKIAVMALFSQLLRIISGPITIVLVASRLSNEEMSFYYSFFNVIAIQQILELGLGFVIRQYIAHDFKLDGKGSWDDLSKNNIKSYMNLSYIWFFFIAVFILFGVGLFGQFFFSSYTGIIIWQQPWWAMVILTGITVVFTPLQFLVEGCQKQLSLYRARVLSAITSAIALCISLYFGFGLFSIAISVLFSNVALYAGIFPSVVMLLKQVKNNKPSKSNKDTLIEIWPMLSRISITWIMGYFFWNAFNLIAFKLLPIDLAGRFGFTLSLARAGLSVVDSVIASQTTIYSSLISDGRANIARIYFNKVLFLSSVLLVIGYGFYVCGYIVFPQFFVFSKTLDLNSTLWMFLYFILLFPVLSQANFCRCFKIEPYFYLSFFVNIQVPVVFFISCYLTKSPTFKFLIPFSLFSLLWSCFIYKKQPKDYVSKVN